MTSHQSPSHLHFNSRRSPIYSTNGCIATSQPLATSIGLHILRSDGNAADSTIAIAAALAVCEPCSTGLGGDAFGLWYDAKAREVEGLNGSGRSPATLDLKTVEKCYEGLSRNETKRQFEFGVHSITVPGAAQAWEDVHSKYGSGRFTLLELLEPAIKLGACDDFQMLMLSLATDSISSLLL
jgi:gamma-glutamyltranspeptidase/glutathione hydrolase